MSERCGTLCLALGPGCPMEPGEGRQQHRRRPSVCSVTCCGRPCRRSCAAAAVRFCLVIGVLALMRSARAAPQSATLTARLRLRRRRRWPRPCRGGHLVRHMGNGPVEPRPQVEGWDTMERFAQCQCGSLRVTTFGEPPLVMACHCQACQRRTGSILPIGAYFKQEQVRVDGPSKLFVRDGASGRKLRFYFCPRRGSTMHFDADVRPDMVGVPVGAFADPNFPLPTVSVWEQSMHHWLALPEGIEHAQQRRP